MKIRGPFAAILALFRPEPTPTNAIGKTTVQMNATSKNLAENKAQIIKGFKIDDPNIIVP